MKWILLMWLLSTSWSQYARGNSETIIEGYRLIGLIESVSHPLTKSIVVVHSVVDKRTLTLKAYQALPGTNFRLTQIHRHHLIYSDGNRNFRLVKMEETSPPVPLVAEKNQLDGLSDEDIVAQTNMVWQKLQEKAKEKKLTLQMGSDTISTSGWVCEDGECEETVEDK
ncbi:MAG: hypothetical protein HRU19_17395 [Pseudobacteriovorax sp.]|nr:hypothetical protein [Pseudobacteriovorax sp.]